MGCWCWWCWWCVGLGARLGLAQWGLYIRLAQRHRVRTWHGMARWKAHSQGSTAVVAVPILNRPEVRPFETPIAGPARPPAKPFAEPRLPEKVPKAVERAETAICGVAEIARWHARAATMGRARAWGTPGHCGRVRALEKLEIVPYYVSWTGQSRRSSRSTKITPASKSRVLRCGLGFEPPHVRSFTLWGP